MQAEPVGAPSVEGRSDLQLQAGANRRPVGMSLMDFPEVGRVEEVAAVLRCSKWCVYDMVHTGSLKAIRIGRSIRITRRALEEFLSA
jgi:excisionase family DNA binding protein